MSAKVSVCYRSRRPIPPYARKPLGYRDLAIGTEFVIVGDPRTCAKLTDLESSQHPGHRINDGLYEIGGEKYFVYVRCREPYDPPAFVAGRTDEAEFKAPYWSGLE